MDTANTDVNEKRGFITAFGNINVESTSVEDINGILDLLLANTNMVRSRDIFHH
jgi:hypothetical protein